MASLSIPPIDLHEDKSRPRLALRPSPPTSKALAIKLGFLRPRAIHQHPTATTTKVVRVVVVLFTSNAGTELVAGQGDRSDVKARSCSTVALAVPVLTIPTVLAAVTVDVISKACTSPRVTRATV